MCLSVFIYLFYLFDQENRLKISQIRTILPIFLFWNLQTTIYWFGSYFGYFQPKKQFFEGKWVDSNNYGTFKTILQTLLKRKNKIKLSYSIIIDKKPQGQSIASRKSGQLMTGQLGQSAKLTSLSIQGKQFLMHG